jgi:hypothetical protein
MKQLYFLVFLLVFNIATSYAEEKHNDSGIELMIKKPALPENLNRLNH